MKYPIRTVVIFDDVILIYRHNSCAGHYPNISRNREQRVKNSIWNCGREVKIEDSMFVPQWDITYELK